MLSRLKGMLLCSVNFNILKVNSNLLINYLWYTRDDKSYFWGIILMTQLQLEVRKTESLSE